MQDVQNKVGNTSKMKKVIVIILICFYSLNANPINNFGIGFSSGITSTEQKSLKNFMNYLAASSKVKGKITDNFPSYFYFNTEVSYSPVKHFTLGLFLDLTSTGARWAYSDYSGEDVLDLKARNTLIGFSGYFDDVITGNLNYCVGIKIGYEFSKLILEERLRLGNDMQAISNQFNAGSFVIMPGAKISYNLIPDIDLNLGLEAFYGFDLHGGYSLSSGNYMGPYIETGWNGFRYGGFISMHLLKILKLK